MENGMTYGTLAAIRELQADCEKALAQRDAVATALRYLGVYAEHYLLHGDLDTEDHSRMRQALVMAKAALADVDKA